MSVTKVSSAMQDLTNDYAFSGTVSGTPGITLGSPVTTTSGTAINFTGIPAGTKKIVLSFVGVTTSSTSLPTVRLGDSGGFEASGYNGASMRVGNGAAVVGTDLATGFLLSDGWADSVKVNGSLSFYLVDASTFTWSGGGSLGREDNPIHQSPSGSKSLSAELTQIQVTTANGSDTFTAGKINIQYE